MPIQALHTAAAALTLVPQAHWTVETHRANISSYDGTDAVSLPSDPSSEGTTSPIAADKLFKKELYHYLRWALSASAPGPGIPETMSILGREETLRRLQDAKSLTDSLVPSAERGFPRSSSSRAKDETENEDQGWMGSLARGR